MLAPIPFESLRYVHGSTGHRLTITHKLYFAEVSTCHSIHKLKESHVSHHYETSIFLYPMSQLGRTDIGK